MVVYIWIPILFGDVVRLQVVGLHDKSECEYLLGEVFCGSGGGSGRSLPSTLVDSIRIAAIGVHGVTWTCSIAIC